MKLSRSYLFGFTLKKVVLCTLIDYRILIESTQYCFKRMKAMNKIVLLKPELLE